MARKNAAARRQSGPGSAEPARLSATNDHRYYKLLGYIFGERVLEATIRHGRTGPIPSPRLDAFRLTTPEAKAAFREILDPHGTGTPDPNGWLAFRLENEWLLVDRAHFMNGVVVVRSEIAVATLDHAMPNAHQLQLAEAVVKGQQAAIDPDSAFTAPQIKEMFGIPPTTLKSWQLHGIKRARLGPLPRRENPNTGSWEYVYRDLLPFLQAHTPRTIKTV